MPGKRAKKKDQVPEGRPKDRPASAEQTTQEPLAKIFLKITGGFGLLAQTNSWRTKNAALPLTEPPSA